MYAMPYQIEELQKEKFAIFVIATHYEGEPPDDSASKWEELSGMKGECQLSGLKYMMFALGDLTYKHYCGFGKAVDQKLQEFSATAVRELGTGSNDQNKIDTFYEKWLEGIWGDVLANAPLNPEFDENESAPLQTAVDRKYQISVNTSSQLFDLSGSDEAKGLENNAAVSYQ